MPKPFPKVCLLNDSFPPQIDGVANAVYNYADILNKSGCGVVVATPKYPDVTDDYPFPVVRYASVNTTRLVGYRAGNPFDTRILQRLAREECDVIHSHCPVASTLLARTLRGMTGAPIIMTYHTKFDIDIANAVKSRRLQHSTLRLLVANIEACDEIWTVSRGAADNLRSLGFDGDIIIMENGVDLKKGRAPAAETAALRAAYGIPQDTPLFLFVGRMMWYKGVRMILDGLKAARARGADFRMLFVGDGHDRPAIERAAAEMGLQDRCVFAGAEHDRAKIACFFSAADLFLFPSTFDTNGIVVREAAACSLPSVLVRGSCAAEGVTDGENALLIGENAGDMTNAILSACADRERLRRIGARAAETLYLSWEDSVARAAERYRTVLDNYRSGKLATHPAPDETAFLSFAGLQEQIASLLRVRDTLGRNGQRLLDELRQERSRSREQKQRLKYKRLAIYAKRKNRRAARLRSGRYL